MVFPLPWGGVSEILAVKQKGNSNVPRSPKGKKGRKPSPKRSKFKTPLEGAKVEAVDDPKSVLKDEGAELSTSVVESGATSLEDSMSKEEIITVPKPVSMEEVVEESMSNVDPTRILKRGETLAKSDPKLLSKGGGKEQRMEYERGGGKQEREEDQQMAREGGKLEGTKNHEEGSKMDKGGVRRKSWTMKRGGKQEGKEDHQMARGG